MNDAKQPKVVAKSLNDYGLMAVVPDPDLEGFQTADKLMIQRLREQKKKARGD